MKIIINFRATLLKVCNSHFNIFLDNGVMTTPKRRILSFVFNFQGFNFEEISFNIYIYIYIYIYIKTLSALTVNKEIN